MQKNAGMHFDYGYLGQDWAAKSTWQCGGKKQSPILVDANAKSGMLLQSFRGDSIHLQCDHLRY